MAEKTVRPEGRAPGAGPVPVDGQGEAPCPSFDHESFTLTGALGISDERASEIRIKVYAEHERRDTVSQVVEAILCDDELAIAEKAYALVWYGRLLTKMDGR